jgi:hypothetical protein
LGPADAGVATAAKAIANSPAIGAALSLKSCCMVFSFVCWALSPAG